MIAIWSLRHPELRCERSIGAQRTDAKRSSVQVQHDVFVGWRRRPNPLGGACRHSRSLDCHTLGEGGAAHHLVDRLTGTVHIDGNRRGMCAQRLDDCVELGARHDAPKRSPHVRRD